MDGIIFDVDGTLWDSTDEVAKSWNQVLREHTDIEPDLTAKRLEKEFGKPMEIIISNLFPELGTQEKEKIAHLFYAYENEAMKTAPCRIYPGMKETVKKLSEKHELFIVSNCQAGYIEAFLENTGLSSYFTDYTCPGDTGVLKAENIKIIMDRNKIRKAVYVGDTQGDDDACREAGIPMIYASYGFGEVADPGITIRSLSELLDLDYEEIE